MVVATGVPIGDVADSELLVDIEPGPRSFSARRPLHWRSLVVRVLGVVAATVACLTEGKTSQSSRRGMVLGPMNVQSRLHEPVVRFAGPNSGDTTGSQVLLRGAVSTSRQRDGGIFRNPREREQQREGLLVNRGSIVTEIYPPGAALAPSSALFAWLVDSSIWMASSLASLVPFVTFSARSSIDWRPFWAGLFESLVVYTLDHLRDASRKAPLVAPWKGKSPVGPCASRRAPQRAPGRIRALRALGLVGFVGFLASIAAAPAGRRSLVAMTFGVHLCLCVAYAKLKPRMPYLKAAYVSLAVVFMAVAAPSAYDPGLLAGFTALELMRLILVIFSVSFTIENLQDLRDVHEDKEAGIVTLPLGLGAKWTARLLLASQVGCVAFQIFLALPFVSALPLRADMVAVHFLCALCALAFSERTPRCFFQVILEPLYVSPLAMLAVRTYLM